MTPYLPLTTLEARGCRSPSSCLGCTQQSALEWTNHPRVKNTGRPGIHRDVGASRSHGVWILSATVREVLYLGNASLPRLVWLSELSAGLHTKGLPVRFPIQAHAWVVGYVPSRGRTRGNRTLTFLSLSFSLLSPSIKINKIEKRKKEMLQRGLDESEGTDQRTFMHDSWTRTTVSGLTEGTERVSGGGEREKEREQLS